MRVVPLDLAVHAPLVERALARRGTHRSHEISQCHMGVALGDLVG